MTRASYHIKTAKSPLKYLRISKPKSSSGYPLSETSTAAIPDHAPDRWLHEEHIGNIPAEDVYNAFMKLSYKERRMIEKRLAICMQCKRVSDPAFRTSFEDMAIDFELKSPRAAEKNLSESS